MQAGTPGILVTPDGTEYQVGEGHKQPIYDEALVESGEMAAEAKYKFFESAKDKGLLSTNMGQAKRLPGGLVHRTDRIGIAVLSTYGNTLVKGADVRKFLENVALDFKVNKIEMAQGPAVFFPDGFGLVGATNENNESLLTNGIANEAAQLGLQWPVVLDNRFDVNCLLIASERGDDFDENSTRPSLSTALYCRFALHGFQFAAATTG